MTLTDPTPVKSRRGTTNSNSRGSSTARRARRVWILLTYASDVPGFCRCYRCGWLLFNPDDPPGQTIVHPPKEYWSDFTVPEYALPLTIDRIIPGCRGGTYRRENIRPACSGCNSETGGRERARKAGSK